MSPGTTPPDSTSRSHPRGRTVHVTVTDRRDPNFLREGSFSRFPIRIGRRRGSDIELPFTFVSSAQAELFTDPRGKLFIRDLGAQNQLVVSATPVPTRGEVELQPHDQVTLGPLQINARLTDNITTGALIDEDAPASRAHQSLARLRASHKTFSSVKKQWHEDVKAALAVRDEVVRSLTLQLLAQEFPHSDWETATDSPHILSTDRLQDAVSGILTDLAPQLPLPETREDTERTLLLAVRMLRAFAATVHSARLSLDRSLRALGSDMSTPSSSLSHSSPSDLLALALDWRDRSDASRRMLRSDLHTLTRDIDDLSSATIEALHDLLMSLSPPIVEHNTHSSWPTRSTALWRSFCESFHALAGEGGRGITPAFQRLFSASLARVRGRTISSEGSR